MAVIASHQSIIGIKKAATWGTAVQCDKRLRVSQLSTNLSFEKRVSGNADLGYLAKKVKRGANQSGGSITVDAAFGGEWAILAALFAGTSTASPTEQTASQGDYLHNIDFGAITSSNDYFFSLAHLTETDVVGELTTSKMENFNFSGSVNGGLSVTSSFISERYKNAGTATSVANLQALTFTQSPEEPVMFNGANMYMRLAPYSTVTALSSTHDVNFTSFTINTTQSLARTYGARGADTQFTYNPFISSLRGASFSATLAHIDDSITDLFAKYESGAPLMAEIFVDGMQIGSGVNTSLKFQIPSIVPLTVGGYGISGQATQESPVITGDIQPVTTAAAGMAGVTDVLYRLVSIDKRSTSYTA